MASTYSTNLALELIGTGDQAGTWGNTTNTNLGTLIEQAISGYVTQAVATGTDTTLTIPNGATGVARNMYIELTGTGGTNTNLIVPSNKKLYFIYNNASGAVTVKVSGQTGVSVAAGTKVILVSNGTDIVEATTYLSSLPSSLSVTTLTATSANITTLTSASATITNLIGTTLTISGNSFLATSSGNVGIGTVSPLQKLDVRGNLGRVSPLTGTQQAAWLASNTGGDFYVGIDNSTGTNFDTATAYAGVVWRGGAYPICFVNNSIERARITSGGNLLVGTATDVSGLSGVISDVAGNVRNIPSAGAAKTSNYTLAITDIGEFVTVGTAGSITVPNDIFAAGNAVSLYNDTTGNVIVSLTITTAYIAGTNTDKASVTLATRGLATILFVNPSLCVISGNVS